MLDGAFSQPEITGILFQECGISKVAEETTRGCVSERSSITLTIAGSALAVTGELVGCLPNSCLQAGSSEGKRIKSGSRKKVKLLPWRQRRGMLPAGNAELGYHAQDALRLLFLLLLSLLVGDGRLLLGVSARRSLFRLFFRRRLRLRCRRWLLGETGCRQETAKNEAAYQN